MTLLFNCYRVQLTSDGRCDPDAVEDAFGGEIESQRCSSSRFMGMNCPAKHATARQTIPASEAHAGCRQPRREAYQHVLRGAAESHHADVDASIHTGTGFTNAFSKKIENQMHDDPSALHALQLLPHPSDHSRVTPAMAAGLTSKLWEIEDLVGLIP